MNELLLHLLAAFAAGIGAVCRFLLDGVISAAVAKRAAEGGGLPWGTLAVNLSGSLAIGVVAGLLVTGPISGGLPTVDSWPLAGALGLLGGYTTFSTASYQTVRLVRERRWVAAVANGLVQLVVTVALVGLGWWLAEMIAG
ncbi:fluoride efflux transporter FluC [Leucobacter soli]|uniref:Fluoride-specific ion channel FluC n=1 Tax=Leucobacter soli TaxID=2812850 RepID=A0A916JWP7_9MICO|nr:CrcB family protein [Leucobacter soli]CAG7611317.1 Putative fluoride ion transporter CrcB [Leucobacter soli]